MARDLDLPRQLQKSALFDLPQALESLFAQCLLHFSRQIEFRYQHIVDRRTPTLFSLLFLEYLHRLVTRLVQSRLVSVTFFIFLYFQASWDSG